jgi:hypothetical protein
VRLKLWLEVVLVRPFVVPLAVPLTCTVAGVGSGRGLLAIVRLVFWDSLGVPLPVIGGLAMADVFEVSAVELFAGVMLEELGVLLAIED